MDPVPPEILSHTPRVPFALDTDKFLKNVRSAKRGAVAGTFRDDSGAFAPSLGLSHGPTVVLQVGGVGCAGSHPTVIEAIRMERMTALRKANGGVRGTVVGDVVRRLVARTMAQPLGPQVESATVPFQYALSTRAGSEYVAPRHPRVVLVERGSL